jgi:hypothetical protein
VYFKQALLPVLEQLSHVNDSEVLLFDDSGDTTEVLSWLEEWDCMSKVRYENGGANRGIGYAWNECVKRSIRPIVHILHQDDVVLDGFYSAVLAVFEAHPSVDAVYNRTLFIDENGIWQTFSIKPLKTDGLWSDFASQLFSIDIQCPSMVLRRSVFDRFGLFNAQLRYQLDFELWSRISTGSSVYYLSQPRTCFRVHSSQASTALVSSNTSVKEFADCLPGFVMNCPDERRAILKIDLVNRLLSDIVFKLKVDQGDFDLWALGFQTDLPRFTKRCALEPALRWKLPAAWFRYLTRRE